jgi:hypothetical protein
MSLQTFALVFEFLATCAMTAVLKVSLQGYLSFIIKKKTCITLRLVRKWINCFKISKKLSKLMYVSSP